LKTKVEAVLGKTPGEGRSISKGERFNTFHSKGDAGQQTGFTTSRTKGIRTANLGDGGERRTKTGGAA